MIICAMKRKFCLLFAAMVCISMLSGCGADRGAEKNMENSAVAETEAPDAQEETKEAPTLEMEKAESIETEEAEDVSYMFYWDYTLVKSLSDAGYALLDLDGNGVPMPSPSWGANRTRGFREKQSPIIKSVLLAAG